jgi:hypothetical protein
MRILYDEESQTFDFVDLTATEHAALCAVLITANERCFEVRESEGVWYSNEDFVCTLGDAEREALRNICRVL